MANAFSVPASMGQYVDPVNEGLINQVLQSKDNKYNYNLAKIDNLLAKYSSIPLARAQDKEYLQSRLNTIMGAVSGSGKLDMSSSNVTRQIGNNISTAIDDRVVQQIANSKTLINFEQTVAEKKEKNPDLYDDRNYTYAKKMAGVQDYMSGKTDKIGRLDYKDYYDIDKNLTGELEKWAKDFGKTKRVEVSPGQFVIQKATIEELTGEQIENFYKTKVQSDPRLMTQMNINADYQYASMSDDEFKTGYVNTLKATKGSIESNLAAINEEMKNTAPGSERMSQLESLKENFNDRVKAYDTEIESPNFNRQQKQLEVYSQGLLNNYKKTYESKNITAVDFDDTPLKIEKFKLEREELNLKIEKQRSEASALASGAGVGTEFSVNDQIQEEQKDPFTQQEKIFSDSYARMDAYLMQNNEDYAKGTDETRKEIRKQLVKASDSEDIGAQGYSSEQMKIVDEYVANSRAYTKAKSEINNKISTELEAYFNDMKKDKSKINLNNLKTTMPITASLLEDPSITSLSSLTSSQKAKVRLEMAQNLKEYGNNSDLDNKFLDNYLFTIEKGTGLKRKTETKEKGAGYFENIWGATSNGLKALYHGVISPAATLPFKNKEDYEKSIEEGLVSRDKALIDMRSSLRANTQKVNNFFTNDRTLADIDSDEIALEEGQSLRSRWAGSRDKITEGVRASLGSGVLANNSVSIGKSFNPNVKEEKPFATALQSVVISQGITPVANSPYKIQFTPDRRNAIITVNTEDIVANDKGVQRKNVTPNNQITIPVSKMPANILKGLDMSENSWTYDARNMSDFKKVHRHTIFNDNETRDEFLYKFAQNNPELLSERQLYEIASNPASSPFKTKKDYQEIATKAARVHNINQNGLEYINQNIISPEYYVEYERKGGQGFIAKVKKKEGDSTTEIYRQKINSGSYNPSDFSAESFSMIDMAIKKQIEDYVRQNSK